jgi:hypothetical protein
LKKLYLRIEIFNSDELVGDISFMMDFKEIKNIEKKDIFIFENVSEKYKKFRDSSKIEEIRPVLKTFEILEDKKILFSKHEEDCKDIIFSINPPLDDETELDKQLKEIKTDENYLLIFDEDSKYKEKTKELLK